MTRSRLLSSAFLVASAAVLAACDPSNPPDISSLDNWMPGKPKPEDRWKPATAITDPAVIFRQNCLGCHSIGATTSPVIALNNPVYLATISPETMTNVIANGVPGSRMPAFLLANGGSLTPEQLKLLVDYIFSLRKPVDGPLPPYSAPPGDATAGRAVYDTYVASLRKTADPAMFRDGFLTNPAFLGLVSDQYLRTLIIAGAPELGIGNYRDAIPGHALTDQEIADVVAWLISNRRNEFGQPITTTNP